MWNFATNEQPKPNQFSIFHLNVLHIYKKIKYYLYIYLVIQIECYPFLHINCSFPLFAESQFKWCIKSQCYTRGHETQFSPWWKYFFCYYACEVEKTKLWVCDPFNVKYCFSPANNFREKCQIQKSLGESFVHLDLFSCVNSLTKEFSTSKE